MQKIKILFFMIGVITLVFGSHSLLSPWLKKTLVPVSWAEDDDEEEEREDERDDEADENEEADVVEEKTDTKTEYETITTKLSDTVLQTTTQVPRYDSDKDGMYDDEDPHPAINEFLIVKDDNQNGIDDRYEQ
ncbi:MAG: hypothetical protein WC238_02990 [Parcubacteria group bacterium]|jgi:hypothetical protein